GDVHAELETGEEERRGLAREDVLPHQVDQGQLPRSQLPDVQREGADGEGREVQGDPEPMPEDVELVLQGGVREVDGVALEGVHVSLYGLPLPVGEDELGLAPPVLCVVKVDRRPGRVDIELRDGIVERKAIDSRYP